MKLYSEKRAELEDQQHHLNVGLRKIRETVEQVEELQKSLSIKRNELEEKNNLANAKLKQMVSHSALIFALSGEGAGGRGGGVAGGVSTPTRALLQCSMCAEDCDS